MTKDMLPANLSSTIDSLKKSRLYGDLYDAVLLDGASLTDVPFLTADRLHAADWRTITKKAHEPLCVYFTSGTTAEPKAVYFSKSDIESTADYIRWFCEIERIHGAERVIVLLDQSFWGSGYFTMLGHMRAGNLAVPIDADLSKESIAEIVQLIKPTVISSTPSVLLNLTPELQHEALKLIETTGELLEEEDRKRIETLFKAPVYDAYGLTEGVVGIECKMHDGYHFKNEILYLEILHPETEESVPEGDWGELVLTVQEERVMPIIRYKTGDICKLSRMPCACGITFPRIWIKDRKEKFITLYESSELPESGLRTIIENVCGKGVTYSYDVVTNNAIATLHLYLDTLCPNTALLAENIKSFNYDMLYLAKRGKLKIQIHEKNA